MSARRARCRTARHHAACQRRPVLPPTQPLQRHIRPRPMPHPAGHRAVAVRRHVALVRRSTPVMADLQRDTGPARRGRWAGSPPRCSSVFIVGTLGFALWAHCRPLLAAPRCSSSARSPAPPARRCARCCRRRCDAARAALPHRRVPRRHLPGGHEDRRRLVSRKASGSALGVLVGALVLGTALPFGLRALGASWPWQSVMLAVAGDRRARRRADGAGWCPTGRTWPHRRSSRRARWS